MGWELRPYLVGLEAWFPNSGTPAGLKPKNGSFETAKSKAKPMAWIECGMGASALFGWIGGMVPKQRNPSRIQAQLATNSFADVVTNGSFETAKSKAKPIMAWIECGMGASALFGWIGGMVPKQRNPSRIEAQERQLRNR